MKVVKGNYRIWSEEEDAVIREIAGEKGNISPIHIGMMKSQLPNRTYESIRVRARMLIKGTTRPPKVQLSWPKVPKNGDELHVLAIMTLAEKIKREREARNEQPQA